MQKSRKEHAGTSLQAAPPGLQHLQRVRRRRQHPATQCRFFAFLRYRSMRNKSDIQHKAPEAQGLLRCSHAESLYQPCPSRLAELLLRWHLLRRVGELVEGLCRERRASSRPRRASRTPPQRRPRCLCARAWPLATATRLAPPHHHQPHRHHEHQRHPRPPRVAASAPRPATASRRGPPLPLPAPQRVRAQPCARLRWSRRRATRAAHDGGQAAPSP